MPALTIRGLIDDLTGSRGPKAHIKNFDSVAHKFERILSAGIENLTVVADFDYTLSRFNTGDERCDTTHGVFHRLSLEESDKEFRRKIDALRDKYHKEEHSLVLSIEEKLVLMEKWWSETHNLIISRKLHRNIVKELTHNSTIVLKDQCDRLISLCESQSIPLILFSAGIGDVIEFVLEHKIGHNQFNHLHIISNFMKFDEKGICVAFKEPLVHTFNKCSKVVDSDAPFLSKVANKRSVILLGDSLGDIHMDVGINAENELKIGFLNFNEKTHLEHYKDVYDIVLVDEHTLELPCQLVRRVAESTYRNYKMH